MYSSTLDCTNAGARATRNPEIATFRFAPFSLLISPLTIFLLHPSTLPIHQGKALPNTTLLSALRISRDRPSKPQV